MQKCSECNKEFENKKNLKFANVKCFDCWKQEKIDAGLWKEKK